MVKVEMVLARGPEQPDGDTENRLSVRLCLTPQAQLDPLAWRAGPDPWLLTRRRGGQPPRTAEITRVDDNWALRPLAHDDEPLWDVEAGVVRPGELVRLRTPQGDELTYLVVAVDPD